MNNIQIFNNTNFGEIRTLVEGDKVLFCASDVAKALGYERPNDAINAHCRYTVKHRIPHLGMIANANNLKTEEYGKIFYDKSRYSNKEVETFRYYENVIPLMRGLVNNN